MALEYKGKHLCFGGKKVRDFLKAYKKPVYLYDLKEFERRLKLYKEAFDGDVDIHYATKANNHERFLKKVKTFGAGVDVVSAGELKEALEVGIRPKDVIFSGVAKTETEIRFAVRKGIKQLNVESPQELERIGEVSKKLQKKVRVAFRMNPDVNPQTHPYITTGFRENKFGMDASFLPQLERILKKYKKTIQLKGLTIHIGSQLLDVSVVGEAIDKTVPIYRHFQNQGYELETFDVGGGVGIQYRGNQKPVDLAEFGKMVLGRLKPLECKILVEPGRYLVGPAGVLVTQIQYIKETPYKSFAMVDTGMHHLLRPSLYQAHHEIMALENAPDQKVYDVVGPICESSDVLGKSRRLPKLKQDDFLVIKDAGAYGRTMMNQYNSHPHAAEKFI